MRVRLMHPDRAADMSTGPLLETADLARDLGLGDVADLMGGGDPYVREVAWRSLQRPLLGPDGIAWRHAVIADAVGDPAAIRELYDLATHALAARAGVRTWRLSDTPASVVDDGIGVLRALLGPLRRLRGFADAHAAGFSSGGLSGIVADAAAALPDAWFDRAEDQLRRLRFADGVVLTGRLGSAPLLADLVLRTPTGGKRSWLDSLTRRPDMFSWTVGDEDAAGLRSLGDLRSRGLAPVAQVLSRASEHLLGFFAQLRWESAFYLGCLTLRERLVGLGLPTVLPEVREAGELDARGLYDVGLAGRSAATVVGSDLAANGASLIVVTGANRGGKSTLLRALGLAQVMMQAGVFVGAAEFRASVVPAVHTHFRREEDETLRSGKLDEELTRMSAIVDRAAPGDLVLLNESFASTNDVEGARILRHVVAGLTGAGLRVVCVTRLHEFSSALSAQGRPDALFLRAERLDDGRRTFRIVPGDPRPTSHGEDIWAAVMGES